MDVVDSSRTNGARIQGLCYEVGDFLYHRTVDMEHLGSDGEKALDETQFVEVARCRLCPREGLYGMQIPLGAWHTIEVHEPSTILEAKDGAYGK